MKFTTILATAAAFAMAPVAVHAQAAVELSAGTTVMGNDGNAIGTIASNDGTTIVIDTGRHQVPLGADAFGASDAGPTLNITKTQLDEMMDAQVAQAAAALDAALVAGATVVSADAQPVGEIKELDGDNVVIDRDSQFFVLPKAMFALDGNGTVMALANMADIEAALETTGG